MGTPEFAVAPLSALVNAGIEIAGIVTAPDKPAGRGKKIQSSAVKKYADAHLTCPVFQPEKLKNPDFNQGLKELNADIFVVVAFRMLPESVWSMPPLGTVNLHASLLPQYRGAAPINWCIINGETESGVSTFIINKEIDTGKILLQEQVRIDPADTAGILHDKMMVVGSHLLVKTVTELASGTLEAIDQAAFQIPEDELKRAPKIFKEDCMIDWKRPGAEVHNLIRGLSPYPGAFTAISADGVDFFQMKIFESIFVPGTAGESHGNIQSDNSKFMRITTPDGYIDIRSVQLPGKRRMDTEEFLRGNKSDVNNWKISV
jgi:methionyl-tRNA formyltransferase